MEDRVIISEFHRGGGRHNDSNGNGALITGIERLEHCGLESLIPWASTIEVREQTPEYLYISRLNSGRVASIL